MSDRNFSELLAGRMATGRTVCVGLDSDIKKIQGTRTQYEFNRDIVDATHDVALAYKLNLAFYLHAEGIYALFDTFTQIHHVAPEIPVILDCKQGDIDNTNLGYTEFDFDTVEADAVTVHWYMGLEKGMRPFVDNPDKGVFVLCRTSNKGAEEDQSRLTQVYSSECVLWGISEKEETCFRPMYQVVAYRVANDWNVNGNCGVVVGATAPAELAAVRAIVGDMPILIPGLGAQEGEAEATVLAGKNSRGEGMIINSSRGIIFAEDPGAAARELDEQVRSILAAA